MNTCSEVESTRSDYVLYIDTNLIHAKKFALQGMDGLMDLGLNSIVPMHEISMETLLNAKPTSVLVLMEEMDLEDSGF